MATEPEIMVNKLAQGLVPMDEGLEWFASRSEAENRALLRELALFARQAQATEEDVPESISSSGIRSTDTPAVLASRGRLPDQLVKIVNLPEQEFVKAFRLLVSLLSVADARRRRRDRITGCSHWWHHLDDADGG